jgi:hypothetical protein
MRNRIVSSMAALAAIIAFSAFLLAQANQQTGAAKADTKALPFDAHDLTGVWDTAAYLQPKGEVNPLALNHQPTPLPPFTPFGEAKYNANVKFIDAGAVLDCDPFGTARNFFTPRPFEIIPSRDRLLQHFEYYDNWREIWTDGRKMPDDLEPDYMGYSTGNWDGNTFVVESANYNGKQFLTWTGLPLSESMRQTERWQRVDHDTLKIVFTFDDPKMYAKPWTITYFYKLKSKWVLDAHPCVLSEIKEYDERLNHADNLPGRDYKPEK